MPDIVLDVTGLLHPMPVLKTKKAIDSMKPGHLLEVVTKDGAAKADIIYLLQRLDLALFELSEEDGLTKITIKK